MSLAFDNGRGLRAIAIKAHDDRVLYSWSKRECQTILIRSDSTNLLLPRDAYIQVTTLSSPAFLIVDHELGGTTTTLRSGSVVLEGMIKCASGSGCDVVCVVEIFDGRLNEHLFEILSAVSLSDMGFVLFNRRKMDEYVARTGFADILKRATETEDGDALVADGALFPVMGIVPWTYLIGVLRREVVLDENWVSADVSRNVEMTLPVEVRSGEHLSDWVTHEDAAGSAQATECLRLLDGSGTVQLSIRFVYHEIKYARAIPMWVASVREGWDEVGDKSPIINPSIDWFDR